MNFSPIDQGPIAALGSPGANSSMSVSSRQCCRERALESQISEEGTEFDECDEQADKSREGFGHAWMGERNGSPTNGLKAHDLIIEPKTC